MSKIRFQDHLSLQIEDNQPARDFFANSQNVIGKNALRVTFAATHSGRVTRNKALYLPDKMAKSVHTWLSPYMKPVLVHHNDHQDPIGRVVAAEYVDTSNKLREKLLSRTQDTATTKYLQLFDRFMSGKLPRGQVIDFVNTLITPEIVSDREWEGLGYIKLVVDITDPDAIQKFLDGRYLTGSTNATTNCAICTICKTDWAGEDGGCDHIPGEEYDGKVCVLVSGTFIYDEFSMVNKPADECSRVIQIGDALWDKFTTTDVHIPNSVIMFDSVREDHMVFKKENILSAIQATITEDAARDELADKILAHIDSQKLEFPDTAGDKEILALLADLTPPDPVKEFFKDSYVDLVGEDLAEGRLYAEMLYGLVEDADAEHRPAIEQLVNDAKLSAAERKKLSASTFCGPDKSFPVPDCAHVTAARRLAGKYTGPGDKDAILACVNRKAKRLGCDKQTDSTKQAGEYGLDYFDLIGDAQLQQMLVGLQAALKERNLLTDSTSEQLRTIQDQLSQKDKELADLHRDLEDLQTAMADSVAALRESKVEKLIDMKILAGEEVVDRKILHDEFSALALDAFDNTLRDYTQRVDVIKISEKIKSGLAGTPSGVVEDPTLTTNNKRKFTNEQITDMQQEIFGNFLTLRMKRNGQLLADQYLNRMEALGLLLKETKQRIEDAK